MVSNAPSGKIKFGSSEEFSKQLVKGVVRATPSKKNRTKKYTIFFPVLKESYEFFCSDLVAEAHYFFSHKDVPTDCVIMEAEIETHELFPDISLLSKDNIPDSETTTFEDLLSFKNAATKGGVSVRSFDGFDFEDLCDRGSKFFYPPTEAEREERLRDTPQPLLLIPLIESKNFFEGVFSSEEDVEGSVAKHCAEFEPIREVLKGYVMVESLLCDHSGMLNGILAFLGQRVATCMSEKKRYPACQIVTTAPFSFAKYLFAEFLQMSGFEKSSKQYSDGRIVLSTKSRFLFENKIGSPYNQVSGKAVTRKLRYVPPKSQIGKGFGNTVKSNSVVTKDPYCLEKQECLSIMESQNLFDDDEEYFRNSAPLYELQYKIFDWAIENDELYGVDFVYGVEQTTPHSKSKNICQVIIAKDRNGLNIAKIVLCVRLSKFKVGFSVEHQQHLPISNVFSR